MSLIDPEVFETLQKREDRVANALYDIGYVYEGASEATKERARCQFHQHFASSFCVQQCYT